MSDLHKKRFITKVRQPLKKIKYYDNYFPKINIILPQFYMRLI